MSDGSRRCPFRRAYRPGPSSAAEKEDADDEDAHLTGDGVAEAAPRSRLPCPA